MMQSSWKQIVASHVHHIPKVGLVLGSGLGDFTSKITDAVIIPYTAFEGFPVSTVEGHKGQFVFGWIGDTYVVAMQGRFHFYEGYNLQQVTMPIRLMGEIGIQALIVTNAAGGVNDTFLPGQLMLIEDHINFMGQNPLMGSNQDAYGPRFPDMTVAYDLELRTIARRVAADCGVTLKQGVYMAFSGPSYETPAEVRMARMLGADAVGMSTVPEVIVARHMGIRVLGVSCITNMAAGVSDVMLSHEDVVRTSHKARGEFGLLIEHIIREL